MSDDHLNVRGILFNEMHNAAVQIVAAYASSPAADPSRIPQLYKEMIKVQVATVSSHPNASPAPKKSGAKK